MFDIKVGWLNMAVAELGVETANFACVFTTKKSL